MIGQLQVPVVKVYTKIDLEPKIQIPIGTSQFPISSVTGEGMDKLLAHIRSFLPLDFMQFPEDVYTKQDMRFRISEIIREQVFLQTHEELPHSSFV
ncbi:MAG: hypothetical protein H6767_06015 [Candidatus Peribacteria bacterium]|nr:MAG: hypothetical protein H6767_06015 [Candidatus Peribacteria bacterium]